jgi:L-threonylcarbamoyladenylate synthase
MAAIVEADARSIARAADLLIAGRLVAFPTETVYGLGADATNDLAVASIFETKGRPAFNPLIVHVAGFEEAARHAHFNPLAEKLAQVFWPGGLTLVLPRRTNSGVSLLVSAGLDTLALRVPSHPVAQALLKAAKRPIAAPSANASGKISPTLASHVAQSLGNQAALELILDGGACMLGLESSVVGFPKDGPPIWLRPGAVPREDIEHEIGIKLAESRIDDGDQARSSPGQLASHYAPNAMLRLNAAELRDNELLLAFGPAAPEGPDVMNLSPRGDVTQAASNFFAMLRALDARAADRVIAVMPIPRTGLGEAINDRLQRAIVRD